jgi:hypothetical protein
LNLIYKHIAFVQAFKASVEESSRHFRSVSAASLRQPFTEEGNFFEGGKHFWVRFFATVTLRVIHKRPPLGGVASKRVGTSSMKMS